MSAQKFTDFTWNGRRRQAAELLAQDRLSDEEIAKQLGISRRALAKWKKHPDFAARVEAIKEEIAAAIRARGIAERQNRVDALNDRWERLRRLIAARAGDLRDETPGGETGLLVREPMLVKVYGQIDDGQFIPMGRSEIVYKYTLDAALLKELREIEKQAAQELGQWEERHATSGKLSIVVEYADPDADDADN